MNRLFLILKRVWAIPVVNKAGHTFWQAFLAVFMLGITSVLSTLLKTHSLPDTESALIALVTASIAAGFSAVKTAGQAKIKAYRDSQLPF